MKEKASLALAYYTALGEKNLEEVQHYLHPQIQFSDPQEHVQGKEAVLQAAKGFSSIFKSLTIQTHFASEKQAVVIYDVEIPNFTKPLRAASWLSFEEGLISKIDLTYDTQFFKREK